MTVDLSERRVIVVGAGGVGGWLLGGLSKMLEYEAPGTTLVIVDGDTFEPSNLKRQQFGLIGNKAEVRAAELSATLEETVVLPMPKWVVSDKTASSVVLAADDDGDVETRIAASKLLRDGDIVFAVVDNNAARKCLFEAAMGLDTIDVFTGGNDDELYGSTLHYARRDGVEILEDPFFRHPEYANPTDKNPGEMNCHERAEMEGGSQLLATNMAVAAFLLGRMHKTLIRGEEDTEAEIFFDLGEGLASAADRREQVPVAVA